MASISEQRLKEMEAEMNRFEQEIAPSDAGGPQGMGMIIGANTFNTVQAQLRQIRNESSGFGPPPPPPAVDSGMDFPLSGMAPPPPPPPESDEQQPPPLLPPPPPPPLLNPPAFVPPQLRHRAPPPPRPPMHHMGLHGGGFQGHPGGFSGPGPMGQGPMMGPGPMGMGGHPMMGHGPMGFHQQYGPQGFPPGMGGGEMHQQGPISTSPAVIEAKPRVTYSAPPVRNAVPKREKKKKAGKVKAEGANNTPTVSNEVTPSMLSSIDGEAMTSTSGTLMQDDPSIAEMELDTELSVPQKKEKKDKKKKFIRTAAGIVWEDPTLAEWDPDDYRLFCGDLGNEVTDETLTRAFAKYPTFVKAKVVRDRRSNKTKGYGFVSFKDSNDFIRAMREMNGKYVGNRPIKLRKSVWKDRSIDIVRKKEKEKKRLGMK